MGFRLVAFIVFLAWTLSAQPSLQIPAAAQAGPGFHVDAATRAYLDTLSPAQRGRSNAYFEGGYWLILWDFLYGAAVSIVLLATGLSARMRDAAERITRLKPLQTWMYWAEYIVLTFILGFPLTVYENFFREHQYNLSNQTFGAWFGDQAKQVALTVVLGGLAVMVFVGVVRRAPRTWHIWGAAVAIVFFAVGALISPVFIAPLFNKYTLLEDARIRDPILRIARQNGIPATNVYEVDASRQSNRVSANVSGFLGTERITLNDNLLNRCSPQAVLTVMGHEMGHYVLNHVYKIVLFYTLMFLAFFALLKAGLTRSLARWGNQWRIRGIGDAAAIPLAVLVLSVLGFLATPVFNNFGRTIEYEADIFGLNTSRQPDGFAEAALILSEYRKMEPSPFEEFLFFDHPSGRTRIYSSMRWKAENQCLGDAVNPCGH
ncbi:MAG: M48 family metallopeptidase [Bryobacteraceae bacterium]|jgi:STE24 endopeptidase